MGNLVPIGSKAVVGRLANGKDKSANQSIMIQQRVVLEFTHFISLSAGNQEEQLKGIEKFQNMLQNVEGIGEKKNLKKMHVTMMTLNATQEELAALEFGFKRAGDRFTDVLVKDPSSLALEALSRAMV